MTKGKYGESVERERRGGFLVYEEFEKLTDHPFTKTRNRPSGRFP